MEMRINFIDLQSQFKAYEAEIRAEIDKVFQESCYIQGPVVVELESELSKFTGASHSVACSSGTDALLLALMALNVGPGDEVVVPSFTFVATAEVVSLLGATPVFVDIETKAYNMCPKSLEKALTSRTKCVIPVSLFGQVSCIEQIAEVVDAFADEIGHRITIIEDAAQSFGATRGGRRSCNLTTVACTSFFPAKPLGCYGDGGAVFTSDDELATILRQLLNHGQSEKYIYERVGINGRLDSIQAAILLVKLKHYEVEFSKRQVVASNYTRGLKNVVSPYVSSENVSAWAQYCIRVGNRERVIKECSERGIPTAIYYPNPLHLQEPYQKYSKYKEGDLPNTESVSKNIMAIPMSPFINEEQQSYIIEELNDINNICT